MITMEIVKSSLPPPAFGQTPGALGYTRTIIRNPRTGKTRVLYTTGGQGFSLPRGIPGHLHSRRLRDWARFQTGPGGFVQAAVGIRRSGPLQVPRGYQPAVGIREAPRLVPGPALRRAPQLTFPSPQPYAAPLPSFAPPGLTAPQPSTAPPPFTMPSSEVSHRIVAARERLGLKGLTLHRKAGRNGF